MPPTARRNALPAGSLVCSIAAENYTDLGDTSTLADPEVVEKLVEEHRSAD